MEGAIIVDGAEEVVPSAMISAAQATEGRAITAITFLPSSQGGLLCDCLAKQWQILQR